MTMRKRIAQSSHPPPLPLNPQSTADRHPTCRPPELEEDRAVIAAGLGSRRDFGGRRGLWVVMKRRNEFEAGRRARWGLRPLVAMSLLAGAFACAAPAGAASTPPAPAAPTIGAGYSRHGTFPP